MWQAFELIKKLIMGLYMSKVVERTAYMDLLGAIKTRITSAQYEALKVVNKELITLYWDIGQVIAERQKAEGWGKSVVEKLAHDLQSSYPRMQGFSAANLWR